MVILMNLSLNLKSITAMKNNLRKILIWGTKKLNDSQIDSAYLDAELLLSFVIHKNKACSSTRGSGMRPGRQAAGVAREYLYTHPEHKLDQKQIEKYKNQLKNPPIFEQIR